MKKLICSISVTILIQPFLFVLFAQNPGNSIHEKEVSEILSFLSSDDLKGRGNFTPELITAGNFISNKFKEYGLEPFPGNFDFYQPFNANNTKDIFRDQVKWNGKNLDKSKFVYLTSEMLPATKTLRDFNVVEYDGTFTDSIFLAHWLDTTNTLIWWKRNSSNKHDVSLESFRNPGFPPFRNIIFVADTALPYSVMITTNDDFKKNVLFNIIGVLPGKAKPKEIIIFRLTTTILVQSGLQEMVFIMVQMMMRQVQQPYSCWQSILLCEMIMKELFFSVLLREKNWAFWVLPF